MKILLQSICVFMLICSVGHAERPSTSLSLEEQWFTVFGGQEVDYHATIHARAEYSGRLTWQLTVGSRTYARGEQAVHVQAGGETTVGIRLPIPLVKPGVIYPLRLHVTILNSRGDQHLDEVEHTIWSYPETIFHEQTRKLTAWNLHLFDPAGNTAETLQAANVPFKRIHNLNVLEDFEGGVVIIGEGTSLRDFRALPALMVNLAAQGHTVLCLAPTDGVIPLSEFSVPTRTDHMILRHASVITALDKRLDAKAWPENGQMVASKLHFTSEHNRVVAAIGEEGWPWFEVRSGEQGRLIVCGFAIIEKWNNGPTPRFLFERILESLANSDKK